MKEKIHTSNTQIKQLFLTVLVFVSLAVGSLVEVRGCSQPHMSPSFLVLPIDMRSQEGPLPILVSEPSLADTQTNKLLPHLAVVGPSLL